MTRDLSLIRELLLLIETKPKNNYLFTVSDIPRDTAGDYRAYTEDSVWQHLELLKEAKLIEADFRIREDGQYINAKIKGITWEGYEFLESVRETDIFNKIKAQLGKISNFTIPIVQQLGAEFIKAKLS